MNEFTGPHRDPGFVMPQIKIDFIEINNNTKNLEMALNYNLVEENLKLPIESAKLMSDNSEKRDLSKNQNNINLKFFKIVKTLRDSVNRIKKIVYYRKFENMTTEQRKMLNDISYYELSNIKNQKKVFFVLNFFFSFIYKIHQKIFKSIANYTINPSNLLKRMWDILFIILTFINFFIYSLDLSLFSVFCIRGEHEKNSASLSFLNLINMIFYFLDLIISYNTGYIDKGQIIMDQRLINKHYLNNYFCFDLLSFISILLMNIDIFTQGVYKLPIFFFFFIYRKFKGRLKEVQDSLIQENEELDDYLTILILYCKTFFISHIMGCLWFIIGHIDEKNGWLYKYSEKDWITQYLYSIYLALVTMLTVGYGDLTPQTDIEKIWCIVVMLVGFTVFGFTLGSICDIIQKMNAKSQELRENHKVITKLMKKNNVGLEFQSRVRKYIEYIFQEENDKKKEEDILEKLSKSLKNEFFFEIYKKNLLGLPCFKENFSEKCIMAISHIIKKIDVPPEETIVDNQNKENNNFYFIFKGKAIVNFGNCKNNNRLMSLILEENSIFNEIQFFTNRNPNQHEFSIKTESFCTLYVLNRIEFISLLKSEFPLDYEKFCLINDKITFQNNITDLKINCLSCKTYNHHLENCPFLHYIPNKKRIFAIHNNENKLISPSRFLYNRKSKKINSKKYLGQLKDAAEKILNENETKFTLDSFSDEEENTISNENLEEFTIINQKEYNGKKRISKINQEEINFNENQNKQKRVSKLESLSKKKSRETKFNNNSFIDIINSQLVKEIQFYRRINNLYVDYFEDDNLFKIDFDFPYDFKIYYSHQNFYNMINNYKKIINRKSKILLGKEKSKFNSISLLQKRNLNLI